MAAEKPETRDRDVLMRTVVQLKSAQHEWLRRKSFWERRSMADIIRELVEKRMEDEPQEEPPR
ncbi:MAG: hypothetical protein WD269_01400 [Acidimicrobiia bacterium]